MESFEQDGIWFLPENPDREIAGTLSFSSDQVPKLNLFGDFSDIQNIQDIQKKLETGIEYPVINGYLTKNSEPVTLCKCQQKKEFKTGIQTSEIYSQYVLKGYHFCSLDEIKFQGVLVQYDYLEQWVNLPNIDLKAILDDEQTTACKEINLIQKVHDPITIGELNDCFIMIIDEPFINPERIKYANFFGWNRREILLKEKKKILIKSKQEREFKDFLDIIYLIQNFLTFACGQIILPSNIETAIIDKTKEIDPVHFQIFNNIKIIEKEKPFPIEIFYQVSSPLVNKQSFDSKHILFKYTDIKNQVDIALDNWQNIQENLTSIIDLYLGLHYIPVRHANDYFLTLAQAIEGFHRIYYKGKYCDDCSFNKIKQELEKTFLSELKNYDISESFHESLLRKIEYWNEYSLKERLEDLFNNKELSDCLPDNFLSLLEEKRDFIKQVRDTRGSLTHPDANKTNKQNTKSKELNTLIFKLRIILEICLLKTLKLDSSVIQEIIKYKI